MRTSARSRQGLRPRALASLAVAAAGCGSVTSYHSAETLPRGRWHLQAALSAGAYKDTPQQSQTPSAQLELSARVGVASHTDLGVKLYTLGAEASARHRLFDGTAAGRRRGFAVALTAAAGGVRTSGQGSLPELDLLQARAGVFATFRRTSCLTFTVGAVTTGSLLVPAGGGHATGLLGGGVVNLDWQLSQRWHLVPELSIHRSLTGEVPVDGAVAQAGVALGFDL